jgi:Aldo/keto reductase family
VPLERTRVGQAVRDSGVPREQVFVTTKLPPGDAGRERRTLEGSLRALGMDHVDLWLVHWPPRARSLVSTWKELLAARDQGMARAVGVSNYSTAQLDELIGATGGRPRSTRSRGRACPVMTPPCSTGTAGAASCWRLQPVQEHRWRCKAWVRPLRDSRGS